MHRNDRFGAWRQRKFQAGRIERVRLLIDVHKHRSRPRAADGLCRGDESHRHRDHLVSGTNPKPEQCQPKCICSATDPNRVLNSTKFRKILFKTTDERSTGESACIDHFLDRGQQLIF